VAGGIGVLSLGHNHPRILKARIDFQKKKKIAVIIIGSLFSFLNCTIDVFRFCMLTNKKRILKQLVLILPFFVIKNFNYIEICANEFLLNKA